MGEAMDQRERQLRASAASVAFRAPTLEELGGRLKVGDRVRVIGQAAPIGTIVQMSETEPAVARLAMDYGRFTMPRAELVEHLERADEQLALL